MMPCAGNDGESNDDATVNRKPFLPSDPFRLGQTQAWSNSRLDLYSHRLVYNIGKDGPMSEIFPKPGIYVTLSSSPIQISTLSSTFSEGSFLKRMLTE